MRAVLCAIAAAIACAPAVPAQQPAPGDTPVRKLAEGLYQIGRLQLDARRRAVRCAGEVNMDAGGPIELLACLPRGKTHETVFTLDLEPIHLQTALLLLGAEPGRNPAYDYPEWDEDRLRPPGDLALIRVEWEADGARRSAPAEAFLYNVVADTPMAPATWAFLGSAVVDGRFGADLDGSLITTYHDPLAVLEMNLPTVNDDVYYHVNESRCPPVGTPVELVIILAARAEGRRRVPSEGAGP